MSDSTEHLDQIQESQVDKEVTANANFAAAAPAMLFARRNASTALLTWGYYGGRFNGTLVNNGTVSLTASATNYVVVDRTTLDVSVSTSSSDWNDTTTYGRAYKITTGASQVSGYEDHRQGGDGILGGGGGGGGGGSSSIAVNSQTGTSYTLQDDDRGEFVVFSNASPVAVTLPQPDTEFLAGWFVYLENNGAGLVTITPSTSTIDGAATLTLAQYRGVILVSDGTNYFTMRGRVTHVPVTLVIACSDETTDLSTGLAKTTFRMPHAMVLTEVRASLNVAASAGNAQVDINEAGASILSTKLTFDAGEKTTTTAATPPVISDASLADDAEITIDIDSIGSGSISPRGLKVALIGYRVI